MLRYGFYSLFCVLAILAVCGQLPGETSQAQAQVAANPADATLSAAREYVEKSDRYLHHSKLKRGMKGYGLTVFAGTKIEKFDVEIISVIENFTPQQNAILVMVSGQGLEKTGNIQGMSGSPVYMQDPADGKFKLIGAYAFGWSLSKEPLCGIQPIAQMIAMPGVLEALKQADSSTTQPAETQPTSDAATRSAPAGGTSQAGRDTTEFLQIVLNPAKGDFAGLYRKTAQIAAGKSNRGQLLPLGTPLLISGCTPDFIKQSTDQFSQMGLTPFQGGGAGGIDEKDLDKVKLAPGSSVALPLITGDVDMTALGTVTDVVGNTVLALGHQLNGDGKVTLPMSTGYVHTIVANLVDSFKLGSSLRQVGSLNYDQQVGVVGLVGPEVKMIPIRVSMNQVQDHRQQDFSYKIVNEWYYTARLASTLVQASATALRNPPLRHHVEYEITIDFGDLGKYAVSNVGTGSESGWFGPTSDGLQSAASDTARPIAALMNNPFGPPPAVKDIDVKITIQNGDIEAEIIDFKLDAQIYIPGETVTGQLLLSRYRQERFTLPVSFDLPKELPDGTYTLTAGDSLYAGQQKQAEQPQLFKPLTVEELFKALQDVVLPRADNVYLHMPLPRGGIALGQKELPDLPASKAMVIMEADVPDTTIFRTSLIQSMKTQYVIRGDKSVKVIVQKQTNETLLK